MSAYMYVALVICPTREKERYKNANCPLSFFDKDPSISESKK